MRIKLSTPPIYKDEYRDIPITHVCTDSREVMPFDLFFPIKGRNEDGNAYIGDAIRKGAIIARTSLCDFAHSYKKRLSALKYTIAITGSVGKTTTKEFVRTILQKRYKVHANAGNMNNEIGMPLTILSAPEDTEVLLLEMGMNHKGEISTLSKCANPDISVITNIGTAHIGNLGSRDEIVKAKLEILDGMNNGILLVPEDEPLLKSTNPRLTFSSKVQESDFYAEYSFPKIANIFSGRMHLCSSSFVPVGSYLLENLAAACAVGICCSLHPDTLASGIASIKNTDTRYKIYHTGNIWLLDDSYNASFESVQSAILLPDELGYKQKSILLGNIRELGSYTESTHERIGTLLAKSGFNRIYLIGEYSNYTARGAISAGFPVSKIHINENSENIEATAMQIRENSSDGEIILIKASHSERLHRIIKILEE